MNCQLVFNGHNFPFFKTHSSVSAAKKTKEEAQHTSVLFAGTVKLPNSTFCISKTTKLICTKSLYFLPYIYTTSHIKIKVNRFNSSRDICSWKLSNILHIFILCTKLQIHLSRVKITFSCFDFFQILNTYNVHLGLNFRGILRKSEGAML